MQKTSTLLRTLFLTFALSLASTVVMAGDGTQALPYTVAELNAQKEALAASGDAV